MKNRIITGCVLLMIILIIGSSLQELETSTRMSGSLSLRIVNLLDRLEGQKYSLSEVDFIIRKGAHFINYFLLTIFLTSLIYIHTRKMLLSLTVSGIFGVCLAFIDEIIQQGSAGRNSSYFDVFIDCSAVFTALIAFFVIIMVTRMEQLNC